MTKTSGRGHVLEHRTGSADARRLDHLDEQKHQRHYEEGVGEAQATTTVPETIGTVRTVVGPAGFDAAEQQKNTTRL